MKKHKKLWLLAAIGVLCLIALWRFAAGDSAMIDTLSDQNAPERWSSADKNYALASAFLAEKSAIPSDSMGEIRVSIENALTAGGVPSTDDPWCYAASRTEDDVPIVNEQSSASSKVQLTLYEGDYFTIHSMTVLSGWYPSGDDIMHDQIVLDRQTAWNLFYSDQVAGQYVVMDGKQYLIAAVVSIPEGECNALAAGDTNRAWACADYFYGDNEYSYTCYEALLPQPIDDFAVTTLTSALSEWLPADDTAFDNSTRFSLSSRYAVLKNLTVRGITDNKVQYPWYENAARLTENKLAIRLIPEAILLAIPALLLIILLLWLNHKRTWGLHSIRDAAENAVDRKRTRDYEARLQSEKQEYTQEYTEVPVPPSLDYDEEDGW